MSLAISMDQIEVGRVERPPAVLVYGLPKIGKTTWIAQIPGVFLIDAEDGSTEFNVARIKKENRIRKCEGKGAKHKCEWAKFRAWLDFLATGKHDFKAVAIDTLDWLEGVLFSHLIATCPKTKGTIVECHGGFGKAFDVAVDEWRHIADKLDVCRNRGMMIVATAHATIGKFYDPESDGWDRYEMKMQKKGAGFWLEYFDGIFFMNYERIKDLTTGEWTHTGQRIFYTEPPANQAYIAGNRWGLPPKLPPFYDDFRNALNNSAPAKLEEELEKILNELPESFDFGGAKKTKDDVRLGFKTAIDRRGMRRVIEAAKTIVK